jgi:hypothetical protein
MWRWAELQRHVELSCERKAAATVAASAAYQSLCATLERARLDADAKMRGGRRVSGDLASIVRKSAALEQQSARVLEQVRRSAGASRRCEMCCF